MDVCFTNKRFADGLLLAIAGGTDLFVSTQKRYLDQSQSAVSKVYDYFFVVWYSNVTKRQMKSPC